MLDYATEIEIFDAEVRSLVAALDAAGERENTLVIVTSDHGMPFPRIKGHTFDLAHHVPLLMRWPAGLGYPARAIRRGSLFYVHNFAPDRWPCGDPELGLADTDAGPTSSTHTRHHIASSKTRVSLSYASTALIGFPPPPILKGRPLGAMNSLS